MAYQDAGLDSPISPGDSLGDGPDEEEPLDRSKHWGDSDDEEEEEEEEGELIIHWEIEGIRSVDTIASTPTAVETPDVIDLRSCRGRSQITRTKGHYTRFLNRKKK